MPLKPSEHEGFAPSQPHLALMLDESGMMTPVVPGTSVWLVEDATQQDKIFPLVLKKVSLKKLVFQMHTASGVTEYTYQLTTAKPLSKGDLQRLVENRKNQPTKFQK